MTTICKIDLAAFSAKPTPAEIAELVAGWDSTRQANFFIALGRELDRKCGDRTPFQWQYIADDLQALEAKFLDKSGSELLSELTLRLRGESQ